MRVFHLITSLDRAGAENHLRDLIELQLSANYQVECAYLKGGGYWANDLRQRGVKVHDLKLAAYGDLRPICKLRRLIKEFIPAIFHVHLQPAELYGALALIGNHRIPFVVSRHNCATFYNGPFERRFENAIMSRADQVIGISSAVETLLRARNPHLPEDRISVVPYGLDVSPYRRDWSKARAELRANWNVGENDVLIGMVARLIASKRGDILLNAFSELAHCKPDGLKLVIVGAGPEEAALRRRVGELGLADKVVLAGFRSDIVAVMHAFDIFAFPSETEGFGLVLLEAMAAGQSIVACAIPPMTDIVDQGKTGLLIPVGNASAMAQALKRLVHDNELRARFAAAGKARVESAFSLEIMATRIMDVYKRAAERNRLVMVTGLVR